MRVRPIIIARGYNYAAPIVRNSVEGRELALARWGMPSSQKALFDAAAKRADKLRAKGKPVDFPALLKMESDAGTTNIRNTADALAALARRREPLRGAVHVLQRVQPRCRRRHLVRPR